MSYFLSVFFFFIQFFNEPESKYMEGHLKTHDNWAFLARFCFLSEDGQFDYKIQFDKSQGTPNLLLYYDSDDQWPAIYQTEKTCVQKESVLHIGQNQIINLTAQWPYNDRAGCLYKNPTDDLESSKPNTKPITYNTSIKEIINNSGFGIKWELPFANMTTESSFFNINDSFYDNLTTTEDFLSSYENISQTFLSRGLQSTGSLKGIAPEMQIVCHNARRFRSARERWWFIAISNCDSNQGIDIKYKLLMTNGEPGDYWHEHFSADEFFVLPILMCYGVIYSFLILALVMCAVELKARQLLHSTYKIFMVSVFLQYFGMIIQAMALLRYSVDGVGVPKVKMTGRILMAISETSFLLLLLLLAKGFTTTRGRLPIAASVKITMFMCFYSLMYVILFIYEDKVFDPGEVLYLYESPAGYGLMLLRVTAWIMFIYSTVFTLKHYPEKANFYYPFNICGTLWFISGPAFILTANMYIDKWVRESIVCAILLFITFSGHIMFLMLTMPSYANKNFPYHVRTTQIGIMNPTVYGANNLDEFQHHPYEPTFEQTSIMIPLSQRTEDLFAATYRESINYSTPASLFTIPNNSMQTNGYAVHSKQNSASSQPANGDLTSPESASRIFRAPKTSKNLFTIAVDEPRHLNGGPSYHENGLSEDLPTSRPPSSVAADLANVLKWSQAKQI